MKRDLLTQIEDLKRRIETTDISMDARNVKEWGGADVIISSRLSNSIKTWLGDQPLVISPQKTEPQRRAVITQYSKELSWLFYQLKEIFAGEIDYISKYDFYGLLAQSAIDCLKVKQENAKCNELLNAVIDKARSLCKE